MTSGYKVDPDGQWEEWFSFGPLRWDIVKAQEILRTKPREPQLARVGELLRSCAWGG